MFAKLLILVIDLIVIVTMFLFVRTFLDEREWHQNSRETVGTMRKADGRHSLDCEYEYYVNGLLFVGDKFRPHDSFWSSNKKYTVGDFVTVYYNAKSPAESCLHIDYNESIKALVKLMGALLFSIMFTILHRGAAKNKTNILHSMGYYGDKSPQAKDEPSPAENYVLPPKRDNAE